MKVQVEMLIMSKLHGAVAVVVVVIGMQTESELIIVCCSVAQSQLEGSAWQRLGSAPSW